MTHTFNLATPRNEVSAIKLVVSHKGEKVVRSTGISIRTRLWNKGAKTLRSKCKDIAVFKDLGAIDSRLSEREFDAKTMRDVESAIRYGLTGKEFSPSIDARFWPYFKEWSERESPSARFRKLAYNRLSALMGTDDDWDDINGDWYFRFNRLADAYGYSHNYKSTLIAKLKTVMNEGLERGIHDNLAFKRFCTSYKTADTIALTRDEVEALWLEELSGREAVARDCFIIGVYCAGRFQDYSRLSMDNVSGGRLRYTQKKTGAEVVIPCSPRILECFRRNGGRAPKITEQEVNRLIKEICARIGGSFLDKVEIRKTQGARIVIEKKRRCDLVSTHTARRSGASILYLSGVPIRLCRQLTGHSTDSMFLNYVKVSKNEAADMLASAEFFK